MLARDYVTAARASGVGAPRIVRRHVLPNIAPVLVVQLSLALGAGGARRGGLSYLGLGTPPPTPSWGRLLQERADVTVHPLRRVAPGVAIASPCSASTCSATALRDVIDPRLAAGGARPTPSLPRWSGEPAAGRGPRRRSAGARVVDDVSFTVDRRRAARPDRRVRLGQVADRARRARAAAGGARVSGSVRLDGHRAGRRAATASCRGCAATGVAMVFQEPLTALNPLMRVGRQIAEPLRRHRGLRGAALRRRRRRLLDAGRAAGPGRIARAYPHQLSGGQRQRVGIAMALACAPRC